jgi:hypothetical protein
VLSYPLSDVGVQPRADHADRRAAPPPIGTGHPMAAPAGRRSGPTGAGGSSAKSAAARPEPPSWATPSKYSSSLAEPRWKVSLRPSTASSSGPVLDEGATAMDAVSD